MFPRDMLVPARMWQWPWGHPGTGRQMPGKAHTPEGGRSKPRGKGSKPRRTPSKQRVGLFQLPGSFAKGGTLAPAHHSL